ncbi:MAG: DUF5615 family PIN-like protein [Candidatus Omnitrophota bacterium]
MSKLRILIDECLDRRLAKEISSFHVKTVPQMGWSGLMNGKLLTNAQAHFDVFITSDQNLSYQHNLDKYQIAVIVLCPIRNRMEDLKLLMPSLLKALTKPSGGKAKYIRVVPTF